MDVLPIGPFPRIYRQTVFVRRLLAPFLAVAFVVGGTFLLYVVSNPPAVLPALADRWVKMLLCGFGALGYVLAYVCIKGALHQRVILREDAIEVVGTFATRRIAYKDIGFKRLVPANSPTWRILPVEGARVQGMIMFEMSYQFDQIFLDWFAKIPERPW